MGLPQILSLSKPGLILSASHDSESNLGGNQITGRIERTALQKKVNLSTSVLVSEYGSIAPK